MEMEPTKRCLKMHETTLMRPTIWVSQCYPTKLLTTMSSEHLESIPASIMESQLDRL